MCGGSASSTLPSSLLASQSTQNGNGNAKVDGPNHDPPQELLPNRRPNTEDFLTFLCFRGTSAVLPSHLDFFNTNKNTEQQQTKQKTETTIASCSSIEVKQEQKRIEIKNEKANATGNARKDADMPKFIPFAVRKRADTVAVGSRKQTVQALKKKYKDQRIAKNKAQCKTRSFTAKEAETKKIQKLKQNQVSAIIDAVNEKVNKRKLRGNVGNGKQDAEVITPKLLKIVTNCSIRPKKSAADINKVSIETKI